MVLISLILGLGETFHLDTILQRYRKNLVKSWLTLSSDPMDSAIGLLKTDSPFMDFMSAASKTEQPLHSEVLQTELVQQRLNLLADL